MDTRMTRINADKTKKESAEIRCIRVIRVSIGVYFNFTSLACKYSVISEMMTSSPSSKPCTTS